MNELKVYSVSTAMVPDFEAMFSKPSMRRFIGYRFVASAGPAGGFEVVKDVSTVTPRAVEFYNEYIRAIQLGDLLPADEATAKLAGVSFAKKSGS